MLPRSPLHECTQSSTKTALTLDMTLFHWVLALLKCIARVPS
jgi:hypothetical protein